MRFSRMQFLHQYHSQVHFNQKLKLGSGSQFAINFKDDFTLPFRVEPDPNLNFGKNWNSGILKFGNVLVGKLYSGKTSSAKYSLENIV